MQDNIDRLYTKKGIKGFLPGNPGGVRNSIIVVCQICNQSFTRCKAHVNRRKHLFCSRECYKKWRYSKNVLKEINKKIGISHIGKKKTTPYRRKKVICQTCGKEVEKSMGEIQRKRRILPFHFCSRRCWGIWMIKNTNKRNTDIERIMERGLREAGIEFITQEPIGGVAIVDFLVRGKLVVQADGDYWHTKAMQRARDIKQDRILKQMGYVVLRFLGSKIKEDYKKCIERIKQESLVKQ